jgi:hypothetical protein
MNTHVSAGVALPFLSLATLTWRKDSLCPMEKGERYGHDIVKERNVSCFYRLSNPDSLARIQSPYLLSYLNSAPFPSHIYIYIYIYIFASPTSGRSAGLFRSRTQATEFSLVLYILEHNDSVTSWRRTKYGERWLKSAKEIKKIDIRKWKTARKEHTYSTCNIYTERGLVI